MPWLKNLPLFRISIHAPREGGDMPWLKNLPLFRISIHAPREGGDIAVTTSPRLVSNFNPRPPRGGRQRLLIA